MTTGKLLSRSRLNTSRNGPGPDSLEVLHQKKISEHQCKCKIMTKEQRGLRRSNGQSTEQPKMYRQIDFVGQLSSPVRLYSLGLQLCGCNKFPLCFLIFFQVESSSGVQKNLKPQKKGPQVYLQYTHMSPDSLCM